tara:strand:- start:535 stop:660 length:126 start_codon:yes stop_codon:yes gene_type:complete
VKNKIVVSSLLVVCVIGAVVLLRSSALTTRFLIKNKKFEDE